MENIIQKNKKISDAIKILNVVKIKTLIVLDKKRFIGTITDGDIRRGIIKKININSNVLKIANKKSVTTFNKKLDEKTKIKMIKKKFYCLPIISKNKQYIGCHKISDKTVSSLNNDTVIIIMAGGRGKRLDPLTKKIPKPMIKIKNKPMIEHIIEKIIKDNFKKIIITTHYKSELIENYFNKKKYSSKIEFINESKPLGTIGGLSSMNLEKYENCILTNADILSNFKFSDILKYHKLNNADFTITTYIKKVKSEYGNLSLNGKMIRNIKEKPSHIQNISIGIYAFKTNILKNLERNKYCDVPTLINRILKSKKKVVSFPLHENWLDIGDLQKLKLAKKQFNSKF